MFLMKGITLNEVGIMLPEGNSVVIPVIYVRGNGLSAEAAVRKDAGDDPDVTNGMTIVASVTEIEGSEIVIAAGEGVGTVTKPGLSVAPGEPAINPSPRRMISDAVREVTDRGVRVIISVPGGKEIAAKTFNPRLGIVGGLSILGTSGRVRPFSCPALRTSLKCLLDVALACGIRTPVFVPGHIGERAAKRHFRTSPGQIIEIGNEWGFMLDCAAAQNLEALMVLGHPGKLAKLAMGSWDTHSSRSKSALLFVSTLAGDILKRPMQEMATVEGIFSALSWSEREELGNVLAEKIRKAIENRIGEKLEIAVSLVNMRGERIGSSGDLRRWT